MKNKSVMVAAGLVLFSLPAVFAQTNPPAAPPKASATPKLSEAFSKNLAQTQTADISRERREQAYSKLLEAQRYIWTLSRPQRSQEGIISAAKLAKQSLQKAVELDPTLAEGYTALAELYLTTPPPDLDEAIMLANIAVKINPNNFGGHQLLGRIYSIKSGVSQGELDLASVRKAISEWKEVAQIDSRNAEAFAFLSEFYNKIDRQPERIEALRNWMAAATPLDSRFYRAVVGKQAQLSPDFAALKLGEALIENGEVGEAVEVLSRAVADNPDSSPAIELLRQAVETADNNAVGTAIQSLQQAVFANPENSSLVILLAQVQARVGKIDDAGKTLREAAAKITDTDNASAANLQVALGDIYFIANRLNEAVAAYQMALAARGISKNEKISEDERDFAMSVYEKMINTYKKENRPDEVKTLIDQARILFGDKSLFADKQLVSFYRESGKNQEALQVIRAARSRNPDDYGLLRTEAMILTDTGKVDEAVSLIKKLTDKKTPAASAANSPTTAAPPNETGIVSIVPPIYDDFINYLFISNLYSQAKRGREAIEAANQAYNLAQGNERRQIAKLTLATVQQTAGEYAAAEVTLRELLKTAPQNPIALNNLGYFLVERNEKLDEALDLIQQAVKTDPTNSSYLDSLGWAYFKIGKLAEAEKYLKDALRYDGSSATINEHLGDVHQKQGKPELAKSAWQKALNLALDAQETNRLKAKLKTTAEN